jgi:hypothetical protein
MAEQQLWEWLAPRLPRGQYTRIETGDTGPGFPDVHFQISPGVSGTIELKDARYPKAAIPFTDEHGIRPSQIRWIGDNLKCGGTVWIMARVGEDIYMISGLFCAVINNSTVEQLATMSVVVVKPRSPTTTRLMNKILSGQEKLR